jgi:hypothetical protein
MNMHESDRRIDGSRKPGDVTVSPRVHTAFMRRWQIVVALTVTAAGICGVANAVASPSAVTRPLILSLVASPRTTAAAGAPVVVTVRVRNAKSCSFYAQRAAFSSLYIVRTVSCASGRASVTMPRVANASNLQVQLSYVVRVRGAGPRSVHRSVTVSEAAGTATQPGPSPAPTPAPALSLQLVSVSVSPPVVPASGGAVTVTVRVQGAVTCTFGADGVTPLVEPCSSGTAAVTLTFVANNGPTTTHNYYVTAQDASGAITPQRSFAVIQQGLPLPPSLQGYLDACSPGPDCFYGPIYASYPDYGNVAPTGLGDCTFAAAADWEQIVMHATLDPTVIGCEFGAAGGTATGGLSHNALFAYWLQQGIAGIRATGFNRYFTDKTNVENGVRDYGAMLVELQFVAGTGFAQYVIPTDAGHMAVVDGFTPTGPLVVTWGQTLQMTWDQWNAEVTGMWGVAT